MTQSAMDQEMRADHFENRFQNNGKSSQLLIDYVRYLFLKMDLEGIHQLFKKLPEILEDGQIRSSPFGFYPLQYLNSKYIDAQGQYFFENLDLFQKLYDSRDIKFVGDLVLDDALYDQNLQPVELSLEELDGIRKNCEKLGGSRGKAASLTFAHTIKAYLKINDVKDAIAFANKNIQFSGHQGSTYLFLLQCFNKYATGDGYDHAFEKWSDKCLKAWRRMAFGECDLALTYYEMAEFYWKLGKKLRAGDLATNAYNLSKVSKYGFRPGEREKIQAQYNQYGSRK